MTCGICGKTCSSLGELSSHSCAQTVALLRLKIQELELDKTELLDLLADMLGPAKTVPRVAVP